MAGRKILQGGPDDAREVVAAVLIKLIILDGDDRVDQVARQLFVGHSLAILDVDLAEDLVVAVEDYAS